MKALKTIRLCIVLAMLHFASTGLFAQGTAFTYQGDLRFNGAPANGLYDMIFTLYGTSTGGSADGGPVSLTAVGVTNGLFIVTVDFFQVFASAPGTYWLDIQVCTNGSGAYNELTPLDPTTSMYFGSQTRQMLNLWGTTFGIGVQDSDEYFRTDAEFFWYNGGVHNDNFGNPGSGTQLMRLGSTGDLIVTGTVTANGVVLTSDCNVKEDFKPVDAGAILDKVAAMPVSEWQFKKEPGQRHLGPMAQDFHAAFGLGGDDDKHIGVVDEGGVALTAIKGLNQKVEAENAALRAENDELKRRLDALERLVEQQTRRN